MKYVKRDLEETIKKYISVREIIAVVGPRQSGKTTMVEQIIKRLKKVNRVRFDDVKTLKMFENDIDSFIDQHVKNYNYIFIDEVQYAKESGRNLKFIYDSTKIKIFISGSSAPDLSIQSLKYLVGRIFVFPLYPFSFKEYLRFKNPAILTVFQKAKYKSVVQQEINKLLIEYNTFGGYPRVVLADTVEDKKLILESIYNTFLLKEIKEILQLSENDKLISLVKALSLQIGNLINYNELSSLTGFSFQQLKRFIKILEETYICKRVFPFFTNKRTEIVKIPKIYFIDMGFRNICISNFNIDRSDRGAMLENFIFSELLIEGKQIKFWRSKGGAEVDFIYDEKVPIEIKMGKIRTLSKSFQSFIEKYKPKKGIIVSLDEGDVGRIGKVSLTSFTKFVVGTDF